MTVSLQLPYPPSTNNLFVNGTKGRFTSQKYESWKQEAWTEILRQRPKKVTGPVSIHLTFQDKGGRHDLDNLLKAPLDMLVSQGIIEADDSKIVRRINAGWGQVEGLHITIWNEETQ